MSFSIKSQDFHSVINFYGHGQFIILILSRTLFGHKVRGKSINLCNKNNIGNSPNVHGCYVTLRFNTYNRLIPNPINIPISCSAAVD